MTDEKFIYEIVRDLREEWEKAEEARDEKLETLIVPCLLKRTYKRVERLQEQINKKSENFSVEPIGSKQIRIRKKS